MDFSQGGVNAGGKEDKGKGRGFGYQEVCWSCHKTGHKSNECCSKWVYEVGTEGGEA